VFSFKQLCPVILRCGDLYRKNDSTPDVNNVYDVYDDYDIYDVYDVHVI
jgi:hypothetical protein